VKFSALPPVRRAVPLKRTGDSGTRASMERFFGNRKISLYASGTAALAQAMINCASRSSVKTPEIIIPAYGCPDLVAACVHASVYPRLVDVAPSIWSYDLEALKSTLSANTVAVVAINLLGVGDSAAELDRLCRHRHIPIIQDSAQHLPRESSNWPGEYVVLSFGRGKPLNLLHGGALISPLAESASPSVQPANYTARARLLSSRAAAVAFNALTLPTIYRIFSALPGTGLGEVVYKPLTNAAPLPEHAWQRVATAFELYRQKPSYRRDIWTAALKEWSDLGIVVLDSPSSPLEAEPLRLPLLAPNSAARDTLLDDLNRAGLGASRFYGTDLTGVAAIPEMVKREGPFPNASALADQLFTLPTHGLVNSDMVSRTRELVRAWHRQNERGHPPPRPR
jgi:dTDP-4-amino-4,6-dideoxygalactose transaminase